MRDAKIEITSTKGPRIQNSGGYLSSREWELPRGRSTYTR